MATTATNTSVPGVGDVAPDFTLPGTPDGDPVTLSSFKGSKHVLLAFYIFDFSPGWTNELTSLRGDYSQFVKGETEVLGISVDHIWAHKAYAKSLGDLPFPILADWDKSVARRYGVLNEERGVAQRSLFLVDYRGYVRWRNPHYDWRSQEQYQELTEAMLALPMIPRTKPATPHADPQGI